MNWFDDADIGADYEQMPELNSFNFSNLADIGSDFEQMPDLSSFNLDNLLPQDINAFLADLGNLGTDSGSSSSFGMDQDLLNQIGLGDLGGGDTGGVARSLSEALSNGDTGKSSIYSLTPSKQIAGTDLYSVGPNQVSLSEDGTGLRAPTGLETKKDGTTDWASFGQTPGGSEGLHFNNMPSQTGGLFDSGMNGAQGLTYYRPAQYDAAGRITEPGGTMTASGFVPDGSTQALGNPNSWINNPNITGQKGVTSANNVVTPTGGGITATPKVTTTAGETKVVPGENKTIIEKLLGGGTKIDPKTGQPVKSGMDPMAMMMLMLMLSQMGKGGSSGSSAASLIPSLSADRKQLPYAAPSRPGAGGVTYFSPNTYTKKAAGGGMMGYAGGGGISSLGGYSDGGQLLKGPGDGVSDNIPATIAGKQPARLANGEFVVPARIVSELGNGSTDAGAKRLYEMMDRVQKARRKTKNVAADTKAHKYLPA
jgi:hypothetical protein